MKEKSNACDVLIYHAIKVLNPGESTSFPECEDCTLEYVSEKVSEYNKAMTEETGQTILVDYDNSEQEIILHCAQNEKTIFEMSDTELYWYEKRESCKVVISKSEQKALIIKPNKDDDTFIDIYLQNFLAEIQYMIHIPAEAIEDIPLFWNKEFQKTLHRDQRF